MPANDIENSFKEFIALLGENGVNIVGKDGKSLREFLEELERKNITFEGLKKIFGENNFSKENGQYIGSSSSQTQKPGENTTPSGPTEEQLTEAKWNKFFAGKRDIHDKDGWKNNFSIEEAEIVYGNGWKDVINQYSSFGQTTEDIDQKVHQKGEIDKVHKLLNKIKSEVNLSNLPNNNKIESYYDQNKAPISIDYEAIKMERDERSKFLFRNAFEKQGSSRLTDDEIDKWRVSETGLSKNGIEERKAFDNGWNGEIEIITGGKIAEFKENEEVIEKGVNVLVVDKNKLLKAYHLLKDISSKNSLHDIPQFYRQDDINELAMYDDKLPLGKKSVDIINKRNEVRNGLWFYLTSTDERDQGIAEDLLAIAEKEQKENSWEIKKYDKLTPEVLNKFLNACEGLRGKVNSGVEKDIKQDLKDLGGFELDEKEPGISAKEDALPIQTRGTHTLPLFYKMNNYDPDNPDFCEWEEVEIIGQSKPRKEVIDPTLPFNLDPANGNPRRYTPETIEKLKNKYFIDGDIKTEGKFRLKGHLAIAPSIGKTTKTICCAVHKMWELYQVGVILICPTEALAQSAYNHHSSWLQKWGCVVHQEVETYIDEQGVTQTRYKSHGEYKVELNKLVKGKGLSILSLDYLYAYMARTLVDVSKLDSTQGGKNVTEDEKKKFEEAVAKIKEEIIEDGTLMVYDEADFTLSDLQEAVRDNVYLPKEEGSETKENKFRTVKMSATFKGKKFSTTSTYKLDRYFASGFKSGTPLNWEEKFANGKSLIFLKSVNFNQISKGLEVLKEGTGETGNGVCHVVYDSAFEAYMEGISAGLPSGSIGIGDNRYGRGFTPDVHNTVSSGLIEVTTLGARCQYSKQTQPYPLAEAIQQGARSGRIQDGVWVTLSTKFEEVRVVADLTSDMVRAVFLGVTSANLRGVHSAFSDANFIRAGVALYHVLNGKAAALEQLLVSLQGLPAYPTFRTEYPKWNPDRNLWARYRGEPEPDAPKWDEARIKSSKDLLKLMIQTNINNDPAFPNKLEVKMVSSLVEKTQLTEEEARQVLNALIAAKIKEVEISDPTYDRAKKQGKKISTIQKIAALHRVTLPAEKGGTKISMGWEKNKDGDSIYVLRMEYNTVTPVKRGISWLDEKLEEIRNLIKGEFKGGTLREAADKALMRDSLEGYKAFARSISENFKLHNELVEQQGDDDNAELFLYRIKQRAEEIEMLQSARQRAELEEVNRLAQIEVF